MTKTDLIVPVWARLTCVCFGGPVVVWACGAIAHKYLLDNPAFVIGSLMALWVAGTGWVLGGRASEIGGWGELQLAEALVIPAATLIAIAASILLLGFVGFGHMH
jgi:hypothetical protein